MRIIKNWKIYLKMMMMKKRFLQAEGRAPAAALGQAAVVLVAVLLAVG